MAKSGKPLKSGKLSARPTRKAKQHISLFLLNKSVEEERIGYQNRVVWPYILSLYFDHLISISIWALNKLVHVCIKSLLYTRHFWFKSTQIFSNNNKVPMCENLHRWKWSRQPGCVICWPRGDVLHSITFLRRFFLSFFPQTKNKSEQIGLIMWSDDKKSKII